MNAHPSLRVGFASFALVVAASLGGVSSAVACELHAASPTAPAVTYPVDICVVSGDKLEDGDMGPPIDYIYKEEGKPDRVVRLCCKGCIKKFNKEPAKYLKKIDDAAAAKANGEKPAQTSDGHAGHAH